MASPHENRSVYKNGEENQEKEFVKIVCEVYEIIFNDVDVKHHETEVVDRINTNDYCAIYSNFVV